MARNKAFDENEALDKAITVFADRGFSGASTGTLLKAMGISRQSLYDTFGDKRQLYLRALFRYTDDSVSDIIRSMAEAAPAKAALNHALVRFARRPAEQGCLGVSAICEFGTSDPEIVAIGEAAARRLLAALEARIHEGQRCGEIDSRLDPGAAARYLGTLLNGLKISARAGATADSLRQTIDIALRNL
ncbi:TetR family transcriptional regulator [Raoultella sp. BIGb0138]|uniref:TetR/AcrR family transcriptional regulator n=1 Tax=Raoultella sp. BIGb0138 TaxID=2485115 RepID=UPI00104F76DD|nr:TetR/AcrR family transcriptional regulator [Raoultella sp. BIGb0138]TCW09362.1 TetR family transcriptional regulator [Raoultella sp. BIGb0138]